MDKQNLESFLEFLRNKEIKHEEFTTQEASDSIEGLAISSIRKYINSKLKGTFISKGSKRGKWSVKGVIDISNDDFLRHMSQSVNVKDLSSKEKMYYSLVDRSKEAFTLSIELYNRPSLKNRVESFAILMVNAWELLLKAEILKAIGYESVFEKNGRSITISQAIKKRLQDNDSLTKNLKMLIELRDDATHLLIPELQPQLSRLFQVNVLYYQNVIKTKWETPQFQAKVLE